MYNHAGDNISKSTLGANSSEVIKLSLTSGNYYICIRSFSGYSDTKNYELAVNEKKTFSIEFDKKFANVGEIVTATIKADNIDNIAGFQANFKVQVLGTGNSSIYDYTDSSGYFEINNAPDDSSYTLQISKSGYLYRTIKVPVNGYQIGTLALPIKMWAGDLVQDNAINLEDIVEICKSFNMAKGEAKYSAARDLNSDGAVNL